jgi:ribonuclease E
MPNTARGGGISRKITAITDRKRLKGVVQSLEVPQGMGLIIRTAGAKRTKAEIKRDYEYLLRLWENIRETTLHSIAPALIYEEEDLVKRAIRDLYDKDIEGVWVEGEHGFKEAREFMRMLMPSQAKKVQLYREPTPLFVKYKVEEHLSQIYSPVVPLRSGGYLVINQTEALVAIDVNSGRSTRERNVEATALKTNMEAAEEATRQLRLRDLAGLIVIDFIDMDEAKNNRAVEKKLKDCLKDDRARVQMGKISPFGLMEISRQRRRSGVLEGTTHVCEQCGGTGRVRSVESSALAALRALEIEALKGGGEASLKVPRAVGLYILNEKRAHLARLQQAFGLFVTIQIDDALAHAEHLIERTAAETRAEHAALVQPLSALAPELASDDLDALDEAYEDEDEDEGAEEIGEAEDEEAEVQPSGHRDRDAEGGEEESESGRRRRRRRRGRRGDEPRDPQQPAAAARPAEPRPVEAADDDGGPAGRRRRRGRRGGRRMREDNRPQDAFAWTRPWVPYGDDPFVWYDPAEDLERAATPAPANDAANVAAQPAPAAAPVAPAEAASHGGEDEQIWVELPAIEEKPKRRRSRGRGRGERDGAAEVDSANDADEPVAALAVADAPVEPAEPAVDVADIPPTKPARARRSRAAAASTPAPTPAVVEAVSPEPEPEPEPELQVFTPAPEPEPVMVAVPDPAEISAPPVTPRRGWWRRG